MIEEEIKSYQLCNIYCKTVSMLYARGQQNVSEKGQIVNKHCKLYSLCSNYSTLPLYHKSNIRMQMNIPFFIQSEVSQERKINILY